MALALNKNRKNIIQPNNNIVSRMNSVSQKVRKWQELVQSPGQNISLVKVIDRGIRTTSRKRTTRTASTSSEPTSTSNLGDRKQEEQDSIAKNRQAAVLVGDQNTKTTPRKVKTASTRRQPISQLDSPRTKCLKRLKPVRKTPSKPVTILPHLTPANTQRNINSLISRWENLSSNVLTPAVARRPKLEAEADSQSGRVLHIQIQLDAKFEEAEVSSPTSNQNPWLRKF